MVLDRRMERDNRVPAVIASPGAANVADVDDEPAARNESQKTILPNLIEGRYEIVVIRDVAELTFVLVVAFSVQ